MSPETANHKSGMNMKIVQPTSYLRGNQIIKLMLNVLVLVGGLDEFCESILLTFTLFLLTPGFG